MSSQQAADLSNLSRESARSSPREFCIMDFGEHAGREAPGSPDRLRLMTTSRAQQLTATPRVSPTPAEEPSFPPALPSSSSAASSRSTRGNMGSRVAGCERPPGAPCFSDMSSLEVARCSELDTPSPASTAPTRPLQPLQPKHLDGAPPWPSGSPQTICTRLSAYDPLGKKPPRGADCKLDSDEDDLDNDPFIARSSPWRQHDGYLDNARRGMSPSSADSLSAGRGGPRERTLTGEIVEEIPSAEVDTLYEMLYRPRKKPTQPMIDVSEGPCCSPANSWSCTPAKQLQSRGFPWGCSSTIMS